PTRSPSSREGRGRASRREATPSDGREPLCFRRAPRDRPGRGPSSRITGHRVPAAGRSPRRDHAPWQGPCGGGGPCGEGPCGEGFEWQGGGGGAGGRPSGQPEGRLGAGATGGAGLLPSGGAPSFPSAFVGGLGGGGGAGAGSGGRASALPR